MIFVTGANGMVGSYLVEIFNKEELYLTDCVVNPSNAKINFLDIRKPEDVMNEIKKNKPKFVIHLAAKTDVDKCELEVDDAYLTNAIGTQNVALACQEVGAIMVYVSTAGVFGGEKIEPYTEFDHPNPANVYGWTKWEGEKIVQSLLNKYYIVRAGWMIGGKEKDKKFVGKMVHLFSQRDSPGKERDKIQAVSDKIGSPTYAHDLLEGMRKLITTGYHGLYHMTNRGVCSRYDVAVEIGKILKKKIPVEPVSSALFPLPAPRARSEAMRNYKLELLGIVKMRTWQEALEEYLKSWAV